MALQTLFLGLELLTGSSRRTGLDGGFSQLLPMALKVPLHQLALEKAVPPSEAPGCQSEMPLPLIFLSWEVQGSASGAESQNSQTQGGSSPSPEPVA